MLRKLADRARNSDIDYRLLLPLLLNAALVQVVTSIMRVTTSYRAVELGLSAAWIGVIAAAFALLPILLAVNVGRFLDRGHDALTAWIGSALLFVGSAGITFCPSAVALLGFTAVMGTGHLLLMASQQMLCVRCASPRSMEHVFGNYMVAGAIGQALGPYVVGWSGGAATLPPTQLLFTIGTLTAAASLLIAFAIRPSGKGPTLTEGSKVVPVGDLLRVPGLAAIIVAGVIVVSASDLIVIYLPLMGTERHIDVKDIGILLTVRAAASMVSRLLYARMVVRFGRMPLMITTTLVTGLSFAVLAVPLPLWAMYITVTVMGFAIGIATTLSISIVIDMTTPAARGTANSLRIMGNRIGQMAFPFGAGLVAAATGVAGILVILAMSLAVASAWVHVSRPGRENE